MEVVSHSKKAGFVKRTGAAKTTAADGAVNWQETPDDQLLNQYLKGQFEAFEQLYARHKGGTYRFIYRQVNDAGVAEELMQELWTKVVSNARLFKNSSKFNTWLYQMARNLLIDRFRHLEVVSNVIVADEQPQDTVALSPEKTESGLLRYRQKRALSQCLEKLPKAQLEAFLLKEEASMLQADIAKVVGVGLEAIKSRLRVAYRNLRECISHKLGENPAGAEQ